VTTPPPLPGQPYGAAGAPQFGAPTPPPYGGAPVPAGGGAPGQPGAPGGGAPGQPGAPFGAAPGPGFGGPPPAPAKKSSGVVKKVVRWVALVAVVGIGTFVFRHLTGDPETASAGDCMAGRTANALKVVECSDPKAEWKVAGKLNGKTEAQADSNSVCAAYPDTEMSFWSGRSGGKGYVLCLEPVKK